MAYHKLIQGLFSKPLLYGLIFVCTTPHAEDIPSVSFSVTEFNITGENPISTEKTKQTLSQDLAISYLMFMAN